MELENTSEEVLTNETSIEESHNDNSIINEGIGTEEQPSPTFTPNYAYKAYGEEREMDEWARPLLTAENQEEMTKLFSRAGGFDTLKDKYEKQKSSYGELESRFNGTQSTLNNITYQRDRLVKAVEMGNYREVLNTLEIPEEKILEYAEQRVAALMNQNTQQFDQRYDQMTSQMNHEFERRQFEQQREQFALQQHDLEINTVFGRPDIAPMIDEYNTRMGSPEAFRGLVEQIGYGELQRTGEHISVLEAVEKAKRMAGLGLTPSSAPESNVTLAPGKMELPEKKIEPVPSFDGSGNQSPVKQRKFSIEALQNEYKELYAN